MFNFNLEYLLGEESAAMLNSILAVYGTIILLSSIFGIVAYVFQSIGLFKMAKNLNLNHAWMAWVPLLNTYTFGKIGSQYVKKDGKPSAKFGGWLIGLEIAMFALLICMIASIIAMIPSIIGMAISENYASYDNLIGSILGVLLSSVGISGVSIAYSVIYYIALWRIYAVFDNSTATVFLIVSILFSPAMPFILFAIRNNKPALTHNERMGFVPPVNKAEPEVEAFPVMEETPITTKTADE